MKIYFHIGPHKTGTTSIQSYLLERLGSEQAEVPVWYPKPAQSGPGHAHLAKQMVEYAEIGGEHPLRTVIDQAEEAGVAKLILSSENFSVITAKVLAACAEALQEKDVTLVTTQNSLIYRAASRWQEWVKGRRTESLQDSVDLVLKSPGYNPLLLAIFAKAICPSEIVVVYSQPNDAPSALVERMNECLGLENVPEIEMDRRLNRSLGWIEVETLRRFNELTNEHAPEMTGAEYSRLRNKLLSIVSSQTWREDCPHIPIEPPAELEEAASRRADEIAHQIDNLAATYEVREYGDRAALKMRRAPRDKQQEASAPHVALPVTN